MQHYISRAVWSHQSMMKILKLKVVNVLHTIKLLPVWNYFTNKEICLVRIVFIYVYGAVLFVRSATDRKKKTFFFRNWICCTYAFITSQWFMT